MMGLTLAERWLIGGALLVAAEMIAPGFFLIWVGGAAMLTGALVWGFGLSAEVALIVFAIAAVGLVYAARTWLPYAAASAPEPQLNQRAARLIGQVVRVEEAISPTGGRVAVGDGTWSARGGDATVGAMVKITATDGNVLIVEKID